MNKNLLSCILFFMLVTIHTFAQPGKNDVVNFISGPENREFASGDTVQKLFYSLNHSRIEQATNSLSNIPLDRCHHGRIFVFIETDSTGKLTSLHLSQASINAKTDSLILNAVLSVPGNWNPVYFQGKYNGFKGNLAFVLLNDHHTVKYSRTEDPGYFYSTVTHSQTKQYDPRKSCEDADFYYEKGVQAFGKGEYKNAITDFTDALSINPYDLDALYNLAISYIKLEKLKDACKCLNLSYQYGDVESLKLISAYCDK